MANRIRDWLARQALPRLELAVLLARVLGRSRAWLIAHDERALSEAEQIELTALVSRRQAGEPIAYLLGEREFMGHTFEVSPAVLIPRPDTETLVEALLAAIPIQASTRILDLGTGSGVIAISLALARRGAEVVATDISEAALAIAQKNAQALGARVCFVHGAWFAPLASAGRFDIIVSNPPYIRPADPHLRQGDLRFEPTAALTDGVDGLEAYRQIIAAAPQHLKVGGSLWFEHGYDQSDAIAALLAQAGFSGIKTLKDLAGHPRVTAAFYNRAG